MHKRRGSFAPLVQTRWLVEDRRNGHLRVVRREKRHHVRDCSTGAYLRCTRLRRDTVAVNICQIPRTTVGNRLKHFHQGLGNFRFNNFSRNPPVELSHGAVRSREPRNEGRRDSYPAVAQSCHDRGGLDCVDSISLPESRRVESPPIPVLWTTENSS